MTENDKIKTLVIPDVHGRDFWRKPVKDVLENTNARVVFLGDYLDPYSYEFKHGFNFQENAIGVFKEIIDLKKQYPDRITLLLGNHDATYRFKDGTLICQCRTDGKNYNKIQSIFMDNKDLFCLADEETIEGKHFIFSHAGIHRGYVNEAFPEEYEKITDDNVVEFFNKKYREEDKKLIQSLGMYDNYRGWGGHICGSIVWADVHSWFGRAYDGYGYGVFGHTQMEHGVGGIITDNFADLDSAEAFVITDKGEIKQHNTYNEND